MENNKRFFAIQVNKSGLSGIYRGAGTKDQVLEDRRYLKAKGVKDEEIKILPIIDRPRQEVRVVEKKVVVSTPNSPNNGSNNSSFVAGMAAGVVATGVVGLIGYELYKYRKRKKSESDKEEEK